jgi:hypothetical protein
MYVPENPEIPEELALVYLSVFSILRRNPG